MASSEPVATAYLDHAASTPMRPAALAAMVEHLEQHHGNPTGAHRVARAARAALEDARDRVAAVLGCSPHGVVFTSGGTEADNLAISGLSARHGRPACPATEHHAVLDPVEHLGGVVLPVDRAGQVDLAAVAALDDVGVVSAMAVNNETGVVADLHGLSAVVREHLPGAVLHTDAVQSANWLDLAEVFSLVDAMSLAGHKFGGPRGCGVLALREGIDIEPVTRGGGQEHERRPGTQNVAAAVAFAVALESAAAERVAQCERLRGLSDRILTMAEGTGAVATVDPASRVPGICHLTTPVESEALLVLLEDDGVMASAASSCASGALQPSHVLVAMGRSDREAGGALRLSMSHSSTEADVDVVVDALPRALSRLGG